MQLKRIKNPSIMIIAGILVGFIWFLKDADLMGRVDKKNNLFQSIKNWEEADHLAAFKAFQRSCAQIIHKELKPKPDGINKEHFKKICEYALTLNLETKKMAQDFFEKAFIFKKIEGEGLLTGYFEPMIQGSLKRTEHFQTPLYKRPQNLVKIKNPQTGDAAWYKKTDKGLREFHDRKTIEQGALKNQNLELVWLDKIDAFFTHIQGSARIKLHNGQSMRVSFAGKSGHPYTPIGKILIEKNFLKKEEVTMDAIRQWLKNNPDQADDIMWHNRSFIFFAENTSYQQSDEDQNLGPIAAANVPLTPYHSIAVDHLHYHFGIPFFIQSTQPLPEQETPLSALVIAQDTGSAIKGEVRADLFIGSGDNAGTIAGQMAMPLKKIMLVPNSDFVTDLL